MASTQHLPFARVVLALALLASFALPAWSFESRAPRAFLYDVNSRTVLYAINEEERFEPASMAKLVTAAAVFEAIANGEITPSDLVMISEDAWRRGGAPSGRATMFAEVNRELPVEDLIRGLTVMAANDAAIGFAQALDGDEAGFAQRMNAWANSAGASHSQFLNATGEPEAGMQTTVQDLVTMAATLLREQPASFTYFAEPDFTWNGIFQRNRNPLLQEIAGMDGLVAGFSEESGYGALGSVLRDGRRIIFALSGLDTAEGRLDEAQRLVRHAFEDFRTVRVAERGEPVAFASVYGGQSRQVGLVAQDGALEILLPSEGTDRVRARVVYNQPIPAPIVAGSPVARLLVERDGTIIQETPLVTVQDVAKGSMLQRARDGFLELVLGWIPPISFAGTFD